MSDTDEPNVHTHEYATDWTHPRLREPDDDLPDIITPLDRIHPLTGRPAVTSGTVTGRAPLTGPSTSDTTPGFTADLHVEVVLRPDLATVLLRRAAELIPDMLEDGDGEYDVVAQEWLDDFRRLSNG